MVNKTPLRLVAIEESLQDADQSASPIALMPAAEAITRKVPNSAIIAAQDTQTDQPASPTPRRRPAPVAAIAVGLTVAIVVVAALAVTMRAKKDPTSAPATAASPVVPVPVPPLPASPQPIVAAPVPAPQPIAQPRLLPEVIRLEITAEPKEAELSLDGNVLAGHRLNLQVPRDRGIHVLSASAPGYIPFNQQVSFSADVILTITLRRGHTPPPARQPSRARPSQQEPSRQPSADVRSAAPSHAGARVEPGMNMEAPVPQHSGKPIDERNPYKP